MVWVTNMQQHFVPLFVCLSVSQVDLIRSSVVYAFSFLQSSCWDKDREFKCIQKRYIHILWNLYISKNIVLKHIFFSNQWVPISKKKDIFKCVFILFYTWGELTRKDKQKEEKNFRKVIKPPKNICQKIKWEINQNDWKTKRKQNLNRMNWRLLRKGRRKFWLPPQEGNVKN